MPVIFVSSARIFFSSAKNFFSSAKIFFSSGGIFLSSFRFALFDGKKVLGYLHILLRDIVALEIRHPHHRFVSIYPVVYLK